MDQSFDHIAAETIDLLEARLRRIEYAVRGRVDELRMPSSGPTAAKRLMDLEQALYQLASKSRVIQDLLRLCE